MAHHHLPSITHRGVMRLFTGSAIALSLAFGLGGAGIMQAAQQPPTPPGALRVDTVSANAGPGRVRVLIEMQQPAAAVTYAVALEQAGARTPQTLAAAATAGQAQMTAIAAEQQQVAAAITTAPVAAVEMFRVQRAMNGIAAIVNASSLDLIRRLPGVRAVHLLELEYPNNSTSVPFVGAPSVWSGAAGVPIPATGTGIRVGIIDTGVDYQHATFGGTALLADYQANDRTAAPDAYYPTAKVVGGWDFVGDAYTGGTAVPDPDPMDCNGHGTHVAATAAGYGVNGDGTTFAGPFGPSAPFASMRIGPGTAPQAQVYALRVFGCGGGTSHTVQAIDWAMDPNGDNDLSDHLDVINMSLGSSFGGLTDSTSIASDNAARAGVIVVSSSGNSGDTYFITGSPGAASRTISTAAITDSNGAGSPLFVNAPGGVAGQYQAGNADFGGPPPSSGTTGNVVIGLDPPDGAGPLTTDACSTLTNAGAVAGNIALVDRGTCGFAIKVKNAQNAGAIAVIVVNNTTGVFNMTAADPTIVIPSVLISQADGTTLRAQIPGLNVTLFANGDMIGSFSSRGPRSGPGPRVLKPDIAAPGVGITAAQTGVVCTGSGGSTGCIVSNGSGFIPNSQALTLNGTSMAAPHVAGIMALLRQLHPTWTVEELKALAMNRALHDVTTLPGGQGNRYGPGRVGAGRVDAALAAQTSVVAFNADDPGLVSVSFDIPEVVNTATQTKTIRIVNHGTTAQTYQLAIDTVVDAPGVAYSLPGGASVTVQPGTTVDVPVKIDATAAQMDHTRDASVSATQSEAVGLFASTPPRHSLTEESGYVTLSQSGVTHMRVPVYAAPRPASMMSSPNIITGGAGTGSTTIPLSGSDVCTGTLAAGPDCNRSGGDVVSFVSPFELQVVSPRRMDLPANWDLQYAGVTADANRIWFGVSTWGDWSSPSDTSLNIYVDIDLNGTYDRIISTTNTGAIVRLFGGQPNQGDTDVFITTVYDPGTDTLFYSRVDGTPNYVNGASASQADSGLFNSNVLFFGAEPARLGLPNTSAPFRYKVVTCPGWAPLCEVTNGFILDQAAGPFFWNGGARGLSFNGLLLLDLNGSSIPVTWNTANMTTNGTLGALLLHHYNTEGQRAEVVLLDAAQQTDLSVTLSATPSAPASGQQTVLTVTVTNSGPAAATGVTVATDLPLGLTHVSDDGGGAYVPYGTWTVGALASGASATLHITTTADDTEFMQARALLSTSTPLDGIAANNEAILTFNAPVLTDLRITSVPAPASTIAGNAFGSTVTITNQGSWPAHNVSIANSIAAGTGAIQGGTPSAGIFTGGTGLWQIATLAPGGSATLNLSGVAAGGPTLSVQSLASSGVTDTNTSNNVALASINVTTRTTTAAATLDAVSVSPGQSATLTVVITDTEASGTKSNPAGTVTFGSSVPGDGFSSPSCALAPVAATTDRSSCAVTVTPTPASVHVLTATYGGSATHATIGATRDLAVGVRPTTITTSNVSTTQSLVAQSIPLTATVIATAPVNEPVNDGTVTFTVRDHSNFVYGVPVTAAVTSNGTVSATFVLPAGAPAGPYVITAAYSGTSQFAASADATKALIVTPAETLTYMLAEGATGTFFDLDILLVNPHDLAVPVSVMFLKEDGSTVTQTRSLDPLTRTTIHVDDIQGLEGAAVSTVVTSTWGLPLVVERTMKWDATGYGAHTDKATRGPASTWYFAEGSQGFFSTFLLLANPDPAPAGNKAHVTYFREGEAPLVRTYDLLPLSRYTVIAANDPGLVDRAFGIEVTFDRPGLAERATYFGTNPFWSGGHASAGSTAPATSWFLAEGATGSFFTTFALIANPNDDPAQVTMTYLPDAGAPVTKIHNVPGRGRTTINIAFEDPTLANAAVGFRATSDRPIVVERAQYWPQPVWIEGHASAGVTEAGTRWGLAEGRVGGSTNDQTYVLLANAGTEDASVTIRFLRTSGLPVVKTFTVPAGSRRNVAVNGAGGDVPELVNEQFGAVIESTAPIFVERSLYSDAGGVTWAAGTNATATRLP